MAVFKFPYDVRALRISTVLVLHHIGFDSSENHEQ
jgi:hypothetical protein